VAAGHPDRTSRPNGRITRAEVARLLFRLDRLRSAPTGADGAVTDDAGVDPPASLPPTVPPSSTSGLPAPAPTVTTGTAPVVSVAPPSTVTSTEPSTDAD
jgi:hypothetical protein